MSTEREKTIKSIELTIESVTRNPEYYVNFDCVAEYEEGMAHLALVARQTIYGLNKALDLLRREVA